MLRVDDTVIVVVNKNKISVFDRMSFTLICNLIENCDNQNIMALATSRNFLFVGYTSSTNIESTISVRNKTSGSLIGYLEVPKLSKVLNIFGAADNMVAVDLMECGPFKSLFVYKVRKEVKREKELIIPHLYKLDNIQLSSTSLSLCGSRLLYQVGKQLCDIHIKDGSILNKMYHHESNVYLVTGKHFGYIGAKSAFYIETSKASTIWRIRIFNLEPTTMCDIDRPQTPTFGSISNL